MSDLSKYTEQQLKDNIKAKKKQYNDAQNSMDPKERAKAPKYKIGLDRLEKELASRKQQEQVTTAKARKDTGKSTSKKPVSAKGAKTKVTKVKKCTTTKCKPKPKPPKPKNKVEFIGDICITIDHLNTNSKPKNTLQFAKMFADNGIPVTVFVQATGSQKVLSTKIEIKGVTEKNRKPIATFTPEQLAMIKDLKKVKNVRLGVHLLGSLDVKGLLPNIAQQKQIDNIKYIKRIIGNVNTASYHGSNVANVISTHIKQVQNSFTKIRGTDEGTRMDKKTGKIVRYIPNNIKYTLVYYSTNKIEKGKITHFFFHAREYEENKTLIEKLISGVTEGSYRALPY